MWCNLQTLSMMRFCVIKAIKPPVKTRQKITGSNVIEEKKHSILLKKETLFSIVADIIKSLCQLSNAGLGMTYNYIVHLEQLITQFIIFEEFLAFFGFQFSPTNIHSKLSDSIL